ncbi:PTS sugar transporter subunit IIA [Lacticaseibacillus paracasei]|uniref:PTS sugar transporter subunit IIA n=1 Tax=Lacticaseibacillus paracasei TaxID=1597 RepID=UPI000590BDFF|nr:PTS N-acetylglucosamine transporter subunit IIBC [Lacticaseibacillus paracasei]ALX89723.1 PTS N-acetylglucosamine transporter subunit IIBC [Lacticaseibacillus paracasei]
MVKRTLVVASHSTLASGMAAALRFFAGDDTPVVAIDAYLDNQPVNTQIESVFKGIGDDEEIVVLTDLLSGSVNQAMFSYRTRPHTYIVTGMNLALSLALQLEPTDDYLTISRVRQLVAEARDNLVLMNDYEPEVDDDDE